MRSNYILLLVPAIMLSILNASLADAETFFFGESHFYGGTAQADLRYMQKCLDAYRPAKILLDRSAEQVVIQVINPESAIYILMKLPISGKGKYQYVDCMDHLQHEGFLPSSINGLITASRQLSGAYVVGTTVSDGPTYFVTIKHGPHAQRFRFYAPFTPEPAVRDPQLGSLRKWAQIINDAEKSR